MRSDGIPHSDRLIAQWGGDPGTVRPVSQGASLVFRFERGGSIYFLKVRDVGKSHGYLAAGIDWNRHLYEHGAFVCEPIRSLASNWIEQAPDGSDLLPGTVTAEVPGRAVSLASGREIESWGAALASVHRASESYVPSLVSSQIGPILPDSHSLQSFWEEIESTLPDDPVLHREYDSITRWLGNLPCQAQLLTHGDVRPGNAIWDGSRASIIDFDEPALGWPAYDIARTLLDDNAKPVVNIHAHLKSFLRGYRTLRVISRDEVEELPMFLKFRVILMYAWSLETPGCDEPQWIDNLRSLIAKPLSW